MGWVDALVREVKKNIVWIVVTGMGDEVGECVGGKEVVNLRKLGIKMQIVS